MTVFKEILHGLQLFVAYKGEVPSLEEMKKNLKGFHSRETRQMKGSDVYILLFVSLESLEASKVILDGDDNVKSADYMGMKSRERQVSCQETKCKINFT